MKFFSTVRAAVAGAFFGFKAAFGAYSDATQVSSDRSGNFFVYLTGDSLNYVDPWTRRIILRKVEWLFQNFGVIKEATRGIARLTVGRGISLTLNTDDEEWNALAEDDFEAYAMAPDRVDLAGRRNFYEIQAHAITQRIKAGEFFAAFVANPRWEDAPCLQLFDPLEIDTPSEFQGDAMVVDGIRLDGNLCPQIYYVVRPDGSSFEIQRSEMVHWFYADGTNQVRGVSDFAQAVAPMQDAKELIKIVTKTAKQNSAIGLHITKLVKAGGQGALDKIRTLAQRNNVQQGLAPGPATTSPSNDPDPQHERLAGGGAIIYTDEKGDAKFLTPNSPSPLVEPFITKVLMRDGLASTGAPAELFWSCADLNSAGQRFVLVKGEALFATLGDGTTGHLCNPTAVRYLIHRMDKKKLRRPRIREVSPEGVETWREDTEGRWMNCLAWQLPPRLSIDNGRDAAAEISQLDNNIETLSSIHDRRGRGWRGMVDQWFRECAYASKAAAKHGAEWALALWRRGAPGAQGGAAPAEDTEEKPEKSAGKPEES
jgi:hypothetical protein